MNFVKEIGVMLIPLVVVHNVGLPSNPKGVQLNCIPSSSFLSNSGMVKGLHEAVRDGIDVFGDAIMRHKLDSIGLDIKLVK